VGETYVVKVSGKLAPVRLTAEHHNGGWVGINTATKRDVRLRSAARLRRPVAPDRIVLTADGPTRVIPIGTSGPSALGRLLAEDGRASGAAADRAPRVAESFGPVVNPDGTPTQFTKDFFGIPTPPADRKPGEFFRGDVVRYAAKFLKSVGWYTDVPDNGTVTDDPKRVGGMTLVKVLFVGEGEARNVNAKNLILASRSHLEPA